MIVTNRMSGHSRAKVGVGLDVVSGDAAQVAVESADAAEVGRLDANAVVVAIERAVWRAAGGCRNGECRTTRRRIVFSVLPPVFSMWTNAYMVTAFPSTRLPDCQTVIGSLSTALQRTRYQAEQPVEECGDCAQRLEKQCANEELLERPAFEVKWPPPGELLSPGGGPMLGRSGCPA